MMGVERKKGEVLFMAVDKIPENETTAVVVAAEGGSGAAPDRLEAALARLEEQANLQTAIARKRLFYTRLGAAFVGAAAIALVWMAGQVLPQVERTLNSANTALATVDIVAQQLANSDLPGILENLDQTLLEGRESINEASDALQQVSEIDFEGLNRAILDLQKVLENPLRSLVGGFRKN